MNIKLSEEVSAGCSLLFQFLLHLSPRGLALLSGGSAAAAAVVAAL